MLTLEPSDSRPVYRNQVNLDHHTKGMSIDPHTKNKSFPANTQTRELRSVPYIKTKSFSVRTQKRSQFEAPIWKHVDFDPTRNNQLNSDPITEIKSISIPTLVCSQLRSLCTKT